MTSAKPQTVGKQLLQQLNAIRNTRGPVDAFTLHRLRVDAQKMAKADRANSHAFLGLIASLDWDVGLAKAEFEKSLMFDRSGPDVWDNYVLALLDLGLFNDAADLALRNVKLFPDHPTVLRHSVTSLLAALRLREACNVVKQMRALDLETNTLDADIATVYAQAIEKLNISTDGVAPLLDILGAFLREKQLRITKHRIGPSEGAEGQPPILYGIVYGDADTAAELSFEFAEKLANERPDLLDAPFLVRFMPDDLSDADPGE